MAEESDKRKLRQKERKVYTDTGIDDDDIDGKRTFVVEEKLASDRYNAEFVREKKGTDVTLKMFQEEGLQFPMVIKDKTGLGMRVPSGRFTVADVKKCVGSRRVLDVMDVVTQRGTNMTMKEWVKYYEDKTNRDKLYNVISLEFSHTRLENYVEQPECVRQIDWVDTVWPPHLKECQTDGTNAMDKMKYPKVQKYCLMSVGGCYTDFHIDMGGTSVWYHILHGGKVFWLIPPTDENLAIYEEWTLSGKQGDDFLADRVSQCQRIQLQAGWTFFIPSGWIHAVYTPEDSLVFGGNFLHSFNVPTQLRAYESESRTHVPQKFRYPFFTELHWYVLDRYVSCVTGKHHRQKSEEEIKHEMESNDLFKTEPLSPGVFDANSNDSRDMSDGTGEFSNPGSPSCGDDQTDTSFNSLSPKSARNLDFKSKKPHKDNKSFNKKGLNQSDVCKPVSVKLENCLLINPEFKQKLALDAKKKVYLTPSEVEGIKAIVEWIESLPITKKMTPKDILDPEALIKDAKRLVQEHLDDDRELCMTGDFVLKWIKRKEPKIRGYTNNFHQRKPKTPRVKSEDGKNIRRRRVRCRKCEPCTRPDCEECGHCKDMKKYGGPGTKKQSCISRQCLAPELPVSAACMLCSTGELTTPDLSFEERQLYECGICWEIVHQPCFKDKNPALGTVEGVINEDLPNSWECPRCCEEGKQGSLKSRVWRSGVGKVTGSRHNSTSSEMSTDDHSVHDLYGSPSGTPLKYKPRPPGGEKSDRSPVRSNKSSPGDENTSPRKPGFRKREAEEGENSPKKKMRLDKGVTRPYNVPPNKPQTDADTTTMATTSSGGNQDDGSREATPSSSGEKRLLQERENSARENGGNDGDEGDGGGGQKRQNTVANSSLPLKDVKVVYKYVVRPAPVPPPPKYVQTEDGMNHRLDRQIWLQVFQYLPPTDLAHCLQVSKTWYRWAMDQSLWYYIGLSRKKIKQTHLVGIIRRQPKHLDLSWTNVSRAQLLWLLERLPQLKFLSLAGNSWAAVSAMCCSSCPLLYSLDLRWVQGIHDGCIKDLVSPPIDHRPGVDDTISRLSRVSTLALAGSDITDVSLRILLRYLPKLATLDLSYCTKITDNGMKSLSDDDNNSKQTLMDIDLSGCNRLTDEVFAHIKCFHNLKCVNLQHCIMVSIEACAKFIADSERQFVMREFKLIEFME